MRAALAAWLAAMTTAAVVWLGAPGAEPAFAAPGLAAAAPHVTAAPVAASVPATAVGAAAAVETTSVHVVAADAERVPAAPATGGWGVALRVVDALDEPVAGATIELHHGLDGGLGGEAFARGESDAHGTWRGVVPVPIVFARAHHPHVGTSVRRHVAVDAVDADTPPVLQLLRPVRVRGRVLDAALRPLPHAEVHVASASGPPAASVVSSPTVRSDVEGRFEVEVAAGTAVTFQLCDERGVGAVTTSVSEPCDVLLACTGAFVVRATFVDSAGQPVEAHLQPTYEGLAVIDLCGSWNYAPSCVVDVPGPGRHTFRAWGTMGFADEDFVATTTLHEPHVDVRVVLRREDPTAAVHGRWPLQPAAIGPFGAVVAARAECDVWTAGAAPAGGVGVQWVRRRGDGMDYQPVFPMCVGHRFVVGLPADAGDHVLHVEDLADTGSAWLRVDAASAAGGPLRFVLQPHASLRVSVRIGGGPARGVLVAVEPFGTTRQAGVDRAGVATFPRVAHGPAFVKVTRGNELLATRRIELRPGQPHELHVDVAP